MLVLSIRGSLARGLSLVADGTVLVCDLSCLPNRCACDVQQTLGIGRIYGVHSLLAEYEESSSSRRPVLSSVGLSGDELGVIWKLYPVFCVSLQEQ